MNDAQPRPGQGIALFDFYSHAHMHLPFNEAYLRIIRTAFPDEPVTFHAGQAHLENLMPRADGLDIRFRAIAPYRVPLGLSHHNPLGAWSAAAACLRTIRGSLAASSRDAPVRLAALLGVDAGLCAMVGRFWRQEAGPVHMLMHGSLAANYVWRSRNPLLRMGDFRSILRRPLRPGVRIIGLELGVVEAIGAEFPALAPSLGVLEHPVLAGEWSDPPASTDGPLAIGFLGYGSARKGFDIFAAAARDAANPALAFDAVGHGHAIPGLDTGALRRKLAAHSLTRDAYLADLRALDLVCLPLHGRSYDFAASGTVSDAVAALKPVIALRNRTLQAIHDAYGPIGRLFDDAAGMTAYLRQLDRAQFDADRPAWVANLRRMRAARLPQTLGASYRA